jgi:hypothetical protein
MPLQPASPKRPKRSTRKNILSREDPCKRLDGALRLGGKGVDREREWRYLIQWAKSEDGETWDPTWEPLSTMYDGGHKQRMAEMFEDRMKDEDSEGAPAWADVLVSLEESPLEEIC